MADALQFLMAFSQAAAQKHGSPSPSAENKNKNRGPSGFVIDPSSDVRVCLSLKDNFKGLPIKKRIMLTFKGDVIRGKPADEVRKTIPSPFVALPPAPVIVYAQPPVGPHAAVPPQAEEERPATAVSIPSPAIIPPTPKKVIDVHEFLPSDNDDSYDAKRVKLSEEAYDIAEDEDYDQGDSGMSDDVVVLVPDSPQMNVHLPADMEAEMQLVSAEPPPALIELPMTVDNDLACFTRSIWNQTFRDAMRSSFGVHVILPAASRIISQFDSAAFRLRISDFVEGGRWYRDFEQLTSEDAQIVHCVCTACDSPTNIVTILKGVQIRKDKNGCKEKKRTGNQSFAWNLCPSCHPKVMELVSIYHLIHSMCRPKRGDAYQGYALLPTPEGLAFGSTDPADIEKGYTRLLSLV